MDEVTREINTRIAEGLMPERPCFVGEPEKWRHWYDEHVRCETCPHPYSLRARGSKSCEKCIAEGREKVVQTMMRVQGGNFEKVYGSEGFKPPKRKPRAL